MKSIKSVLTAFVVALTVISTTAMAEMGNKPVGSGPNPFTDCGIGAALFSDPSMAWAAVISNITWDAGTTAMVSATASPETCQSREVVAAKFIHETYDNVIEETANGQGAHLSAMLEVFDCQADSHAEIIQSVRSQIGENVQTEDYLSMSQLDKSKGYYEVVHATIQTNYKDQCSA